MYRSLPAAIIATLLSLTLASLAQPQTPDAASRARQFLDLLAAKDGPGAASMLDSATKVMLPADKLAQVWQGLTGQAGAFRQFGDSRLETNATGSVVFVTCEFSKLKLDARIALDAAGMVAGLNFGMHTEYTSPAYVQTSSFHEKELVIGNGETAVHGTLTLPNGTGPFPVVILVHGSGSYDLDYTIGPNKLFRDIGWGVASRGVAVLRYNKRSFEHPGQFSRTSLFTVEEEAVDDALLAAAKLRSMPEIDPHAVFVLGHSLGAMLVPQIGKADPSLAGLIAMAGAARPLLDVIVPQMIHNATLNGPMSAAAEKQVETVREQIARANDPNLKPDAPAASMPLGIPATYWIDFRGYRPTEIAKGLTQPMLILQGGRDYQIGVEEDFALWKTALAGRKNVEFKLYPKLDHEFIEGEGPSSDDDYLKPGHVSGAVVEDIAEWVKRAAH